jgi:mono/diheme cytochrome c family protein
MHESFVLRDRGGDAVTTDIKDEQTDSTEEIQDEKSFFARGVLLGLVGGALAAVLLISVGGSVISLVDDVFGSDEIAAGPAEEPSGEASLVAMGEELTTTNGCIACHSTNGLDGVGPTWTGLFGSERVFAGGGSATADDAYLLESIVNPGAVEVEGFPTGVMPATYGDSISAEDIETLIAYIKSL